MMLFIIITSINILLFRYLNTFYAHNMPVYNIEWNTFIPDIFITCAAEWVIKIWDKGVRYTYGNTYPMLGNSCFYIQPTFIYI